PERDARRRVVLFDFLEFEFAICNLRFAIETAQSKSQIQNRKSKIAMTPALIGKKVGTTRIYDEKGAIVPVTVVQAGPCAVTQIKTVESDGYNAVQLGFGEIKPKLSTFPLMGHAAKAGVTPRRYFREIR